MPSVPSTSASAAQFEGRKSRDRAITLSGDESQPHLALSMQHNTSHSTLPSASMHSHWRASTGRHDLSHRQLMLLRDMLTSTDASAVLAAHEQIPEEDVNHGWRWGDAMNSTITLPTEESSQAESSDITGTGTGHRLDPSAVKRRKSGRLGMKGLRDMLRSLKKSYSSSLNASASQESHAQHAPASSSTSVSMSTDSSVNIPRSESVAQRRRSKTSVVPELSVSAPTEGSTSPYSGSLPHRASPRRPSLASIFRLGQRSKSSGKSTPGAESRHVSNSSSSREPSAGHVADHEAEEEDWDRIESASDLDLTSPSSTVRVEATGTVRGRGPQGRSPYTFALQPTASASNSRITNPSRSSIWTVDLPQPSGFDGPTPRKPSSSDMQGRATKLSNVAEVLEIEKGKGALRRTLSKASYTPNSPSSKRPRSRASKLSLARSLGTGLASELSAQGPPLALAMTPENIKPLLENAKEVQARCQECLAELKQLMDAQR